MRICASLFQFRRGLRSYTRSYPLYITDTVGSYAESGHWGIELRAQQTHYVWDKILNVSYATKWQLLGSLRTTPNFHEDTKSCPKQQVICTKQSCRSSPYPIFGQSPRGLHHIPPSVLKDDKHHEGHDGNASLMVGSLGALLDS